jgi:hypothetical protein
MSEKAQILGIARRAHANTADAVECVAADAKATELSDSKP